MRCMIFAVTLAAIALLVSATVVQSQAEDAAEPTASVTTSPAVDITTPATHKLSDVSKTPSSDAALLDGALKVLVFYNTALTVAVQSIIPDVALPHAAHAFRGVQSVVFGPSNFIEELGRKNDKGTHVFWQRAVDLSTPHQTIRAVVADFRANVLRRFEFSLGSFVGESVVFVLLAAVVRRTSLYGALAKVTHDNVALLVALAAVPTGVVDIAAIVAALASAPAAAFFPALFLGKLARPYVTTAVLWLVRWASAASVPCVASAAQTLIRWSSFSLSLPSDAALAVTSVAAAAAVVFGALALLFPSEQIYLEESDESEVK